MALARICDVVFTILYWLILIRALISWVNPDPYNPIVQFLHRTTEPILMPLRRFMPPMAIDFSPIIAFLLIIFLQTFLVQSLMDMGLRLKNQARYSMPVATMELQPPTQASQSAQPAQPAPPGEKMFN